jgi:hypothetical protein
MQESIYSVTATKKTKGQDAMVQCLGLTKAGTHCKQMTSMVNGYCYQNQPE